MPDMLLRKIPAPMHEALKKLARVQNRSVSDVAKDVMQRGLDRFEDTEKTKTSNAWDAIRMAVGDNRMTVEEAEEFDRAIADNRKKPPRALPDFE